MRAAWCVYEWEIFCVLFLFRSENLSISNGKMFPISIHSSISELIESLEKKRFKPKCQFRNRWDDKDLIFERVVSSNSLWMRVFMILRCYRDYVSLGETVCEEILTKIMTKL